MTGNSSQRRKALRAKERLSKRAMSEGRYPWLESSLAQGEKPVEAEEPTVFCHICLEPASAVRPGKWECRTIGCPENEADPKGVDLIPEEPLAPPEPRGEAEGALAGEGLMNWDLVHEVHTEGKQSEGIKEKRRTLWNWLRKLVGR